MEEPVEIACGGLRLEGALERAAGPKGVVITHPHPLYGGDMNNPVVAAVRSAYRDRGYTTLRFNFRGVGGSDGRHGNGIAERDDVRAAMAHLEAIGVPDVDLAGYSFGAWVNAGAGTGIARMLMVSPPVAFMPFEPGLRLPRLHLVVAGDRDEFAPVASLRAACSGWNSEAHLEVLPGVDHFYSGALRILADTIAARLQPSAPGPTDDAPDLKRL